MTLELTARKGQHVVISDGWYTLAGVLLRDVVFADDVWELQDDEDADTRLTVRGDLATSIEVDGFEIIDL